ncbi:sporulation YhaL family protein [Camelliibacillus cellulosilyticus]|uniref:Sporulation YhaL family protein n=1 Tax=Camelliibacillus cellulosilyticus TaxID=2174486 RepID=A0ABV9GQ81_9BACL
MSKKAKFSLFLIGLLVVLYTLQQFGVLDGVLVYIGALPLWVVLVLAGIIISFWQFLKHSKAEEEEDEEWIEEQGAVYIRRMEAEKEARNKNNNAV